MKKQTRAPRTTSKKRTTKRDEPMINEVGEVALMVANKVGGEAYRLFCKNCNIDPNEDPERERFYKAGIVAGIQLVAQVEDDE